MTFSLFKASALIASVTATHTSIPGPADRVVTLLKNLQKEKTREGKTSKDLFDKEACDLKKTITTNTAAITKATDDKAQAESDVSTYTSSHTAAVADLASAIADKKAAVKGYAAHVAQETKEIAASKAERDELKANIQALTAGVAALKKSSTFIQESDGSSADFAFVQTPAFKEAKPVLMQIAEGAAANVREKMIAAFQLSNGAEAATGSYDEIVGMLKAMLDNFKEDLADIQKKRTDTFKGSDDIEGAKLKATKNQEVIAATAGITVKVSRKADLNTKKQAAIVALKDATRTLETSTAALKTAKETLARKTADIEAKQKRIATELAAIQDVISMLTDDAAFKIFETAKKHQDKNIAALVDADNNSSDDVSFVQIKAHDSNKPFSFVQAAMSTNMLMMFSEKHSHKNFVKITGMVKKMIQILEEDQKVEKKQRDTCTSEKETNEANKEKAANQLATLTSSLTAASQDAASATSKIADAQKTIAALADQKAKALKDRKDEKTENDGEIRELGLATQLMNRAIRKLESVYAKNQAALVQQAPTQGEADDAASDLLGLSFVQTSTQTNSDGKGIIELLKSIVQDFDRDITKTKAEEAQNDKDLKKELAQIETSLAGVNKTLATENNKKGKFDDKVINIKEDIEQKKQEQTNISQTIGLWTQKCTWLLKNYDDRLAKRSEEKTNLTKALGILQGGASFAQAQSALSAASQSFLSKRVKADDHFQPIALGSSDDA